MLQLGSKILKRFERDVEQQATYVRAGMKQMRELGDRYGEAAEEDLIPDEAQQQVVRAYNLQKEAYAALKAALGSVYEDADDDEDDDDDE